MPSMTDDAYAALIALGYTTGSYAERQYKYLQDKAAAGAINIKQSMADLQKALGLRIMSVMPASAFATGPVLTTYRWTGAAFGSTSEKLVGGVVTVTNLLTNGGAEAGWDGNTSWMNAEGVNNTITQDLLTYKSGTKSCKSVVAGLTAYAIRLTSIGALNSPYASKPAVIAGNTYTAFAYFFTYNNGYKANLDIVWFNAAGGVISTSPYLLNPIVTGWNKMINTSVAPAGAAYASLNGSIQTVGGGGATLGENTFIDEVMFTTGNEVPYFDGSTV